MANAADRCYTVGSYYFQEFLGEKTVAVVHKTWTRETTDEEDKSCVTCSWPPYSSSRLSKAVKYGEIPTDAWEEHDIRILYATDSYTKAQGKLSAAEEESDLQTDAASDVEILSKRKRNHRRRSDSESDDSECAMPLPKKPRTTSRRLPSPPALPHLPGLQPPGNHGTPHCSPRQTTNSPVTPRETSANVTAPKTPVAMTATEKRLLELVVELNAKVDHHGRLLSRIVEQMGVRVGRHQAPDVEWPLRDLNALDNLEARLKEDDAFQKQVVVSLSTIGGSSGPDSVRRILKKTIATGLAKQLNWLGKGNKRGFSPLNLRTVVCASVRKMPLCAAVTDNEIEETIKNWLKHAGDRDGGRRARQQLPFNGHYN